MKVEDYVERMSFFPCYKGEKIDEDMEFVYYRISVPNLYFEWHNLKYNKWMEEPPDFGKKVEDAYLVVGVSFIPIYAGAKELEKDDKFTYYKVKVPKVFMNYVDSTGVPYGEMYNEMEEKFQKKEVRDAPLVGELIKDYVERDSEKKEIDEVVLLKVYFECTNPECTQPELSPEVTSDLFDTLHAKECGSCGCRRIKIAKVENLLKKEK